MKKKITPDEISDMLFPINEKISYLNSGGCGVFAVALCRELNKHGIKAVPVIVKGNYPSDAAIKKHQEKLLPSLEKARIGKKKVPSFSFDHAMVKMGKYLLDSRGAYQIYKETDGVSYVECSHCGGFELLFIIGEIPIEDLDYTNKFDDGWNSAFDRRRTPFIEKFVAKQLDKIFKAPVPHVRKPKTKINVSKDQFSVPCYRLSTNLSRFH